ncbi:winged helix-turn-helix transcriptional regulator [Agrobacterium vitis]|uniref:Winged helix-turn-helix transcriptional regulator n=1 Tax=Agrobacterium vitis TaxID=373 RepID=A0ABD6G7R3_AGRVI|nr:sugar-binding domain-containing protein [Agrobacterium vitis]MUO80637.1 winged helix-turn-helix transcriptional regulator [Agrobacterium vitis]MUO94961.1 winged helix-turn-helix transcriptional regulator [Agrobacterium vitis]MUP05247.1 winged helix-turn-helix transcriptional regulator [Agrobacterium vitis]MUZ81992.1 winged helix-turn-helix transcriptional regulator [Agrobacterium vitis]MVA09725.1 winged helix-turn-helix transcriptional regulator [Agrobacterium vitis]
MVAKLHYEAEMSQVEIARKLGISTATVSRLLQRARVLGIVKIEVLDLVSPAGLTQELIEALSLKRAAVIDTPSTGVLGALAKPLGDLLKEEGLAAGSVIGIGWGRAIREVIAAGLPRIPGIVAVALNGGLQQSAPHFQISEFVRQAADQLGGSAHFLHAPYLSSAELKDAFLADAFVQETTKLWDRLDCAIVGIGLPHAINPPEASAATVNERAIGGAVGDVIRHYVDINGRLLSWDGEERMIAASSQQLCKAKLSIGVAATVEKAAGIIGAVRSGMINSLVTDANTCIAILNLLQQDTPSQTSEKQTKAKKK